MGKFKNYLINEEIGLADLGPRIDRLMNSQNFGNQVQGAFVSSAFDGSGASPETGMAGHPIDMPVNDLTIPSVERTGRIIALMLKKNPIYIRLSDGTECNFTYDEYKRIQGNPALGKVMTVMFQRHPGDLGQQSSKIDKAIVRD